MQHVVLEADEFVSRLTDLNRLIDAVAYFKPQTVANYAKSKGVSTQSVYKQIKRKTIMHIYIDGLVFILD